MLPGAAAATAPPSGWQPAALLEFSDEYAWNPAIAVNGAGSAVVAWEQYDGSLYDLLASRYEPGMGWSLPVKVKDGNYTAGSPPFVALDAGGNATIVWATTDNFKWDIWATRSPPSGGWPTMTRLEFTTDNYFIEGITADDAGGVLVVMVRDDGARNDLISSRFSPGSGWGGIADVETSTDSVYGPSLAGNAAGMAAVGYAAWDGSRYVAMANVYAPGVGWGTPQPLESNAGYGVEGMAAAVGPASANIIWVQSDGTAQSLWSSFYTPSGGWGAAELVEQTDGPVSAYILSPALAANGLGTFTTVFIQTDSGHEVAKVSQRTSSSAWIVPVNLTVPGATDFYYTMAWSSRGDDVFVATCVQGGITSCWWVARIDPASGGNIPVPLETHSTTDMPQVAISSTGEAWAAFGRNAPPYGDVVVRHFIVPDTAPPALTLSTPVNAAMLTQDTIWVSGTTEPGATMSVNGVAASVAADGSFGFFLALPPGANTIDARAWDASGNEASASAAVTIESPTERLEADLEEARANLTAAQSGLTAAQSALAAAQAQLVTVRADANSTGAELAAAQGQISQLQSSLAATNAKLNSTSGGAAPASSDMLPLILGVLGIALGGVALGLGMMRGGGKGGGGVGGGRPTASATGEALRMEPSTSSPGTPSNNEGPKP